MQKCLFILVSITFLVIALSFNTLSFRSSKIPQFNFIVAMDTIVWVAPDSANSLVNPTKVDEELLLDGKMIYNKNCRSCHGKLGDGTGSGSKELETIPTDFTNPVFLNQTDGSMFWKISEGRDEMKTYKKKLSEEDIWLVVNYIKKFASDDR